MAERKQLYSVVLSFQRPGILASSLAAYDTKHLQPGQVWHTGGKNGDYIQIPECSREEDFAANHIEIVFPDWGQVMFWTNPALDVVETSSILFTSDIQPPIADRDVLKRCYRERRIVSNSESQQVDLSVSLAPSGEWELSFSEHKSTDHSDSWQGLRIAVQKA